MAAMRKENSKLKGIAIFGILLAPLLLAACGSGAVQDAADEQDKTAAPTASATENDNSTPRPSSSPSASPSPSATHTETATATPSYMELRGQVLPEKLSCRFGPGAAYLYKYGILATTNIEILGRMAQGDWLLVQAIGGDNPCWVKAELLEVDGNLMNLAPLDPHVALVWSPYYGILTGAAAVRDGDTVTLTWHPLVLKAGDDSEQVPYVVEAWHCIDGKLRFDSYGAYYPEVSVVDEAGCADDSRARVAGAEKHGYTPWADFEWPGH